VTQKRSRGSALNSYGVRVERNSLDRNEGSKAPLLPGAGFGGGPWRASWGRQKREGGNNNPQEGEKRGFLPQGSGK